MSKDKLKSIIDRIAEINDYRDKDDPYWFELLDYFFSGTDFRYLIDQAERVQELERELKEWGTVNEVWEEINTKLVEQNKHYRELINNINEKASLFGVDVPVYEAIQDAIKALEGES